MSERVSEGGKETERERRRRGSEREERERERDGDTHLGGALVCEEGLHENGDEETAV